MLVLDDLHWADPASVELLGALLRRPASAPVMLALASRPLQAPERLSAALERATRADQITRIELGALSVEEARELLADAGEHVDADVLYAESGGNPFYLEQLARAGGATAVHDEVSLAGIGLPASVAAALAEELALLSDTQRLVLEGAAVAGDPFEPELAAAAAALTEPTVMEALDELLKVDLLRTTDVRDGSVSAIRSYVAPSTTRQLPAGGSAGTSGAPTRSQRGALPPPRAPTTSSARRTRATPTPSPSFARPARKRPGWHRRMRRTGSERLFAWNPPTRRLRSGSSFSSPARVR